jgi:hypothetical protein
MEQPDSTRESNLDPLPDTRAEYWKEAEVHQVPWQTKDEARAEVKRTLKDHYFIRVSGHQAQCTHCDWGFQLDRGDKIKDGHLYDIDGELVI